MNQYFRKIQEVKVRRWFWPVFVLCVIYMLCVTLHVHLSVDLSRPCSEAPVQSTEQRDVKTASCMNRKKSDTSQNESGKYPIQNQFIIYTRYRSGSSFVGELFNQHPDVFYMFEPANCLRKLINASFVKEHGHKYLQDMLNCKLQQIDQKIMDYNKSSKSLTELPDIVCRLFPEEYKRHRRRDETHIQTVEKVCGNYAYRGMKVIALFSIKTLFDLMKTGVKVIHLVRDPRSNWLSQMQILEREFDTSSSHRVMHFVNNNLPYSLTKTTCEDFNHDLSLLKDIHNNKTQHLGHQGDDVLSYLRDNYRIVRYEDIASDPEQSTKSMYNFLGLNLHEQIVDWIKKNTNQDDIKKNGDRRLYSTQRNTTKTLQEWRQQLPWKVADVIQDQCEEPMRELGYKMAANSSTLLNTSQSLLIDPVEMKTTWLGNYLLSKVS